MQLVTIILSRLTQKFYSVKNKSKKGHYLLAPLVSNKFNGSTQSSFTKRKKLSTDMADKNRKNDESNSNRSNNNHRPNFCNNIPTRVSNRWPNRNRSEESIYVVNPSNLAQCSSFYMGMPFWQPMQYNNLVYGNMQHSVLQPNLSQNYFHRPQQGDHRQIHSTVNTVEDQSINGLRFWESVTSKSTNSGFVFTVMSYNVLAQDLVDQHPYLYTYHKKSDLKWSYRWNNILTEIRNFQPEILCLQEVQSSHLNTHFSALKDLGYEKIFKQRTGPRTDGCAIFYKSSVISLVEHITVEYKQPNVRLLDRDNVAIIAKFSIINKPRKEFVVATTHLLYNPKRQDVRLAQIQLLLTEIDRIAYIRRDHYLPVIVTGDLNSSPESPVYQLITKGKLTYENLASRSLQAGGSGPKTGKQFLPKSLLITDQCQHAKLIKKREENKTISRLEELKLIELKNSERGVNREDNQNLNRNDSHLFSSGTLTHNLCLRSVYQHNVNGGKEATTYQDVWLSVDYIFFSTCQTKNKKLILLERYRLPTDKELGNMKIPNQKLGSDHLSLLAKFQLKF